MYRFVTALSIAVSLMFFAAPAHAQRATFAGAVGKAMPAVVNIYAERHIPATPNRAGADPLMQQLYGNARQPVKERVQRSLGSGVIVQSSGVVVTNLHVIAQAEEVKIALNDGREFPAKLLGGDDKTDLAVLQLQLPQGTTVPSAKFGDATTLRAGDVVLALGNPFGIGQSVTMGVVSAVDRSNANLSPYSQFIQTDAAINPGNSGGALIDSTGVLVGINTAIYTRTGGTMGISFAIPGNVVQTVVEDIVRTGAVTRPWLGAEGQALSPAMADKLGQQGGVYLTGIIPGSPAARAGLQSGDLILALDGKPITDTADLNERLLATPNLVGRGSTLTIIRDAQKQEVPVTFEALPPRSRQSQRIITGYSPLSGLTVEQIGPSLAADLSLPLGSQGVVVTRVGAAPAGVATLPLQVGDVLLGINRQRVATVDDVVTLSQQSKRNWVVSLRRNNRQLTLTTP